MQRGDIYWNWGDMIKQSTNNPNVNDINGHVHFSYAIDNKVIFVFGNINKENLEKIEVILNKSELIISFGESYDNNYVYRVDHNVTDSDIMVNYHADSYLMEVIVNIPPTKKVKIKTININKT